MTSNTALNFRKVIIILLLFITSGCTLKATSESLSDSTTNFVSSTTPGSWYTQDGLLKSDQKINAFVAINYEHLLQEMAQGEGEYLTAFATLLNIQPAHMRSFKDSAQHQFSLIGSPVDINSKILPPVLSALTATAFSIDYPEYPLITRHRDSGKEESDHR